MPIGKFCIDPWLKSATCTAPYFCCASVANGSGSHAAGILCWSSSCGISGRISGTCVSASTLYPLSVSSEPSSTEPMLCSELTPTLTWCLARSPTVLYGELGIT